MTSRLLLLAAFLALPALTRAEKGYYETQREIQHRRDFAREMENLASRPNAPSKSVKPEGKSEVELWLEGKKAAEEAWRNQRAAQATARAAAANQEREAQAARDRAYQAREQVVQEWEARIVTFAAGMEREGFDAADAYRSAYSITPRADGSLIGTEAFVIRVEDARRALAGFNEHFHTATYEQLLDVLIRVRYGTNPPRDGAEVGLVTYFQCGERLLQRFPNETLGKQLAQEMSTFLLAPEKMNDRFYSVRAKVSRIYVQVLKYAPLEGLAVGRHLEAGSAQWRVPPLPDAAVPVLEATYSANWDAAVPLQAAHRGNNGDPASPHFDAAYYSALALARIHEQATDLWRAAQWYARTLSSFERTIVPSAQIPGSIFFEAHPEMLEKLEPETFQGMAMSIDGILSEPLARAIVKRAVRERLPKWGAFAQRAAIRLEDWSLAMEALYTNAGEQWGTPQDPRGTIKVMRMLLGSVPPDDNARRVFARARALQAAYVDLPLAKRLELADEATQAGAWEGRYARAFLLSVQNGNTPDQREEGIRLLRELAAEGLTAPWDGRLGAPHPLCLAAIALTVTRGDPAKIAEARAHFEGVIAQPTTQFYFGRYLANGADFPPADRARGRELLEKAADSGLWIAQAEVGALLLQERKTPQDERRAIQYLEASLPLQNARGMLALGIAYCYGWGVEIDYARALELFENVGGSGVDQAQAYRRAALLHSSNKGIPFNPSRALELARTASDLGDKYAPAHVGTLIFRGEAKEIPKEEALTWWRKGADRGDLAAMRNLYRARLLGDLVPKDEAAAAADMDAFLEKASPEIQYMGARVLLDDHPSYKKTGVVRAADGERWLARAAAKTPRAAEYQQKRMASAGSQPVSVADTPSETSSP